VAQFGQPPSGQGSAELSGVQMFAARTATGVWKPRLVPFADDLSPCDGSAAVGPRRILGDISNTFGSQHATAADGVEACKRATAEASTPSCRAVTFAIFDDSAENGGAVGGGGGGGSGGGMLKATAHGAASQKRLQASPRLSASPQERQRGPRKLEKSPPASAGFHSAMATGVPPMDSFPEPAAAAQRYLQQLCGQGPDGLGSPRSFAGALAQRAAEHAEQERLYDAGLWAGRCSPGRLEGLSPTQAMISTMLRGPDLDCDMSPLRPVCGLPPLPDIPSDSDEDMEDV